jgi:oligopeptide/dipeptide ABC transporter ATP-binding protein
MTTPVLEVSDLRIQIRDHRSSVIPVDGVNFAVHAGEALGLVGESGSGKSLTLRALLGLLPDDAVVTGGRVNLLRDGELTDYDPLEVRGRDVAMIFQEPMTALNPLLRVETLLSEAQRRHSRGRSARRAESLRLLREVGVPQPEERLRAYPHQLSGGLRQRVMIAMALACQPRILLCDEPTTALDVTLQDQVLRLLDRLRQEHGLAIVFVTHDLAVAARLCHRLAVMYAGRVVESGPTQQVLRAPRHPYTAGLVASLPRLDHPNEPLVSIDGRPPTPADYPFGCRFHPRCRLAIEACLTGLPPLLEIQPGHHSACLRSGELGVIDTGVAGPVTP